MFLHWFRGLRVIGITQIGSGKTFLFLQGPHGPYFDQLSKMLVNSGARALRVGFNRGDQAFWENKDTFIPFTKSQDEWPTFIAELFKAEKVTDIVLYGDVPLIRPATIKRLLQVVGDKSIGLLTITLDDPQGYGRIVRNSTGAITSIVEQKDASSEQLTINEVNTGVLALSAKQLRQWLPKIDNNNAQGEYYLTDLIALAVQADVAVLSVNPETAAEVEGVNSRLQLSQLERTFQRQRALRLMESGTTLADPARFDVRGELVAGTDNFIDINCIFEGTVTIGNNVTIGPNCCIINSSIGDGAQIKANTIIEESVVGDQSIVGPFARLRPGTTLGCNAKVGNFVETKKVIVGDGSKINHLSYVGDAQLGENVNIGAGTITCNYDGVNKHKTLLGDGVFVGSNSTLVAPIQINQGGFVAAGSTVTTAVPADSLAVGRAKQRNIDGWRRPVKNNRDK